MKKKCRKPLKRPEFAKNKEFSLFHYIGNFDEFEMTDLGDKWLDRKIYTVLTLPK